MKDIYWKQSNLFKKVILSCGWLSVVSLIFWGIMMIIYYSDAYKKREEEDKKKFNKFINPHTLKVVYIFGWFNFIALLSFLIGLLLFK